LKERADAHDRYCASHGPFNSAGGLALLILITACDCPTGPKRNTAGIRQERELLASMYEVEC